MMVEFLYLHLKKEKEKEIITSAEYIAFGTGIKKPYHLNQMTKLMD